MATLKVEYPKDLLKLVGRELGPSEWVTVDQAMIDKFADATGDHQWIHDIAPTVTWGTSPQDALPITARVPDPAAVGDVGRRESMTRPPA